MLLDKIKEVCRRWPIAILCVIVGLWLADDYRLELRYRKAEKRMSDLRLKVQEVNQRLEILKAIKSGMAETPPSSLDSDPDSLEGRLRRKVEEELERFVEESKKPKT